MVSFPSLSQVKSFFVSETPKPAAPKPAPKAEAKPEASADTFERVSSSSGQSRNVASTGGPTGAGATSGPAPTKLSDADRAKLKDIAAHPERAGVSAEEAAKLKARLESPSASDEALLASVARSPNADRGAWTYARTKELQSQHPDRISDSTVTALTKGVSEPRSGNAQDTKGVMGQDQADRAAKALVALPQEQFDKLGGALEKAGTKDGKAVPGADPNMERALTLKALGAREKYLDSKTSGARSADQQEGVVRGEVAQVLGYAENIRGMKRGELVSRSTAMDTNADGKNDALKQRFSTSCVQTTTQLLKAEADPVYAFELSKGKLNSTNAGDPIGAEQRGDLTRDGGTAVPRGAKGGVGTDNKVSQADFDRELGALNGQEYRAGGYKDPDNFKRPTTPGEVQSTLSSMDAKLARGTDVPMRVEFQQDGQWNGHMMMVSDVRGEGANKKYQVTDPSSGKTQWYSAADLANGKATLDGAPMRVTHSFVPREKGTGVDSETLGI